MGNYPQCVGTGSTCESASAKLSGCLHCTATCVREILWLVRSVLSWVGSVGFRYCRSRRRSTAARCCIITALQVGSADHKSSGTSHGLDHSDRSKSTPRLTSGDFRAAPACHRPHCRAGSAAGANRRNRVRFASRSPSPGAFQRTRLCFLPAAHTTLTGINRSCSLAGCNSSPCAICRRVLGPPCPPDAATAQTVGALSDAAPSCPYTSRANDGGYSPFSAFFLWNTIVWLSRRSEQRPRSTHCATTTGGTRSSRGRAVTDFQYVRFHAFFHDEVGPSSTDRSPTWTKRQRRLPRLSPSASTHETSFTCAVLSRPASVAFVDLGACAEAGAESQNIFRLDRWPVQSPKRL